MEPYYDHGGLTIYHGDCREVLPHINHAHLLLTDPPYGVSYATNRILDNGTFDRRQMSVANDDSLEVLATVWPSLLSRLPSPSHWYCFASPKMLEEALAFLQPKQILCWDKGDRGTVGDLECGFGEAWEAILYGMKGRRPLNGPRPRSVIRHDWSSSMDPVHPTVKPVPLLERLIQWSSDVGEIVLDPFMGSGTTLRAAKNTKRRAIGIEVEEVHCEMAVQRLRQEVLF